MTGVDAVARPSSSTPRTWSAPRPAGSPDVALATCSTPNVTPRLINRSKATVRPGRRDDRSLGPATKVHFVVDAMLTSTMSAGSLTPRYTVGQDALKLRFEGRSLPTGPRESSAGRSSNPGPKEPRD